MKYKMRKMKTKAAVFSVIILLLAGFTSCSKEDVYDLDDESLDVLLEKAEDVEDTVNDEIVSEDETDIESLFGENTNDESTKADENIVKDLYDWPAEADAHGLSQPEDGYVNAAGIYNGAISIGIAEITRDQVETYKNSLPDQGFLKDGNWPGYSLWHYMKDANGSYTSILLAYTDGTLSIVINEEDSLDGFAPEQPPLTWNPSISEKVPVFEYGTIIGAGNAIPYVMEYNGVSEDDYNSYLSSLEALGFVKNNSTYEYSNNETMEYITVDTIYEDGYVTLSIVSF